MKKVVCLLLLTFLFTGCINVEVKYQDPGVRKITGDIDETENLVITGEHFGNNDGVDYYYVDITNYSEDDIIIEKVKFEFLDSWNIVLSSVSADEFNISGLDTITLKYPVNDRDKIKAVKHFIKER